ncbi:MAG TPA: hypothetical protein PLS53_11840 [Thermoanaerobaculaceae bacterium]|nr:hypothetical protein [Thermoanaerobaculaceae bacterium]HPS78839.1 hypothetical protein [Thermoanaerobaculaceae bacterium]
MIKQAIVWVALVGAAAAAVAQGPDAEWRTITTPHFRVHYPAPAEAWTLRASGRMEAIRERVAAEVGYAPPQVVDVVVEDPIAQPNGMSLPLLDAPRMVLWTSPPGPDSAIGNYADWAEDLIVHEDTHTVHLLRPSRHPLHRLGEHLLPLGPIVTRAPRWVHEGYATLVEGKLTALGRPNGDLRAAILRRWAQAGRLPSYAQMANDSQGFLGMSMAYLVGSAYLEWLVERTGPDSLRQLWARLSARTNRDFDGAFEGVFGDGPAKLYDRFKAELTWRAMEVERRLAPVTRDGELWQDLEWSTGEPAVSPDGTRLAIVLRSREGASRLVVWSTGPDDEAEKKWKQRVDRALSRDPQDVAPMRIKPLRRKALDELVTVNGAEPSSVRFMPGGKSVLFVRFEPDADGFLHPDLFRWDLEAGRVVRLTVLADVRAADPAPDGAWAAGVRNRYGLSQLVRVDLASGEVSELTPASASEVFAWPRVSPDGATLAFMVHRGGRWRVMLRTLADSRERELATPAAALVAHLAWTPGGDALLATYGRDGLVNVARLDLTGVVEPQLVTRSAAGCLAPAPTPDGRRVFFLALEHDGLDLRVAPLDVSSVLPGDVVDSSLAPAMRPVPPPVPEPFRVEPVVPGRPYGLGRQELRVLAGGMAAPAGRSLEVGLRSGDVVGRLSLLALGAFGDDGGPGGGAVAAVWRGWPAEVGVHAFRVTERPSEQRDAPGALGETLDGTRSGVELRAAGRREWRATSLAASVGILASRFDPELGDRFDQRVGTLAVEVDRQPSMRPWRLLESLHVRLDEGVSDGEGWQRAGGEVSFGAAFETSALVLSWQRHAVHGDPSRFDLLQLGGVTGSLLPGGATGGRIAAPGLPAATLVGNEHEGQKASLEIAGMPLFFERRRVWNRGGAKGEWLRMAGLEVDLSSAPVALVKLPGLRLRVGAARILDEPLKDVNRAWVVLAWRP